MMVCGLTDCSVKENPMKFTETHRLGDSVHIAVADDQGNDIYPGGRYVPAAEWDDDAEAVGAKIAEHLTSAAQAPVPAPAVKQAPVEMTDQQITTKLEAIAQAKAAEEAAKKAAEEESAEENLEEVK